MPPTRDKVIHLQTSEHYQHGWQREELLRQHPDLRPEEVYAALAYFYDHYAALVAKMNSSASQVAAARAASTVSRSELLRRQAARGG